MKTSNEPSIDEGFFCHADAEEYFTFSKLIVGGVMSANCIFAFIYLDECLFCSWQMAVSHLHPHFFTDEMVSNVFSVAFRAAGDDDDDEMMMIHSYV